ncbi:unnamed protein product [Cylicocyclus nassatus]|uniref:Uncharacterized protein n=1 Tax=Cylicocyclus nassatus TaxID=53992 RepID=A0AA36M6Y0_CYLNA|nr:unnamed protein product [Cylicocyclus nassatus]
MSCVESVYVVQTQKLQTVPSDEEIDSQETNEDSPEESTIIYQELLRAQLYRQLQEIKKAFRLHKAFKKVDTL